ncbi:MAG: FAD-dependent oxidoreductase [Deltaproteobacteria bacterium]|nr:FAD-dependent oxidoreductase [Deltaproteobacteria bacterium]
MATFDYDIGVIGGGAAGLTVVAGAARLGARVVLIEKEGRLGGDCLHHGCVPSKTLLHAARLYHQARTMDRFGLPAVTPGPVDFRRVRARIREVIAAIEPHDSPARFCGLGAMVRQGQPEFVDEHLVQLGSERVSARFWVVATGSEPAMADVPGLPDISFLTNKELFDLDELPSSLLILGGGAIAVEMAQAFARLGGTVTILQRGTQLLSREDPDMAALIQGRLEEEGVRCVLGFRATGVTREHGLVVARGEQNGQACVFQGARLLVARGRRANTTGLGLGGLGIEESAQGLAVDSRLRTVHGNIFAAGDVTGKYQFTHAAGYEGGVVIANTVFRLPRKADHTWMPWCVYTEPELASIGLNEKRALARGIAHAVWTEDFAANDRALAEGEGRGMLKMLVDERERPLGVQIYGPRAGELLGVWATFFAGNMKLPALAGAVFPYPTMGEISKRVAGSLVGRKLFSERVRKGLALIFQLKGRADGSVCGLNEDDA